MKNTKKQVKNTKKMAQKPKTTKKTASKAVKTAVNPKTTNKSTKPKNAGNKGTTKGRISKKLNYSVRETTNGIIISIK